jgi:tetratricopeptide (TPR) repeat protein
MAASAQPESDGSNDGPSCKGALVATALKWVGGAAAVVSLLLALNQVTGLVQNFRIHHAEFSAAMKAGEQQQKRGDYPAAFESFKHAAELDPIDRGAQRHEADVAMLWLENAHSSKDKSFTELANQLVPALDKALTNAKGPAAADILAHIGWANFLRYRENPANRDLVAQSYQDALKIDLQNPYAHAMLGHWILWNNGKVEDANREFSAALASGREHGFVRELQLSAFNNEHSDAEDAQLLRIANEMRVNKEPIKASYCNNIYNRVFYFKTSDLEGLRQVFTGAGLKPEETLATYDWLTSRRVGDQDVRREREFVAAFLAEMAGNNAEALSKFKALQAELQGQVTNSLLSDVGGAIKGLSGGKAH